MKYFLLIPMVFAVIFLAWAATGLFASANDFRTNPVDQEFRVATAVNVTSTTVQLDAPLWNELISGLTISSNVTTDAPVATSYNATNRAVEVVGLAANMTRLFTVNYRTAGLTDYPGAEDASTKIPTLFLILMIMVVLIIMGVGVAFLIHALQGRG